MTAAWLARGMAAMGESRRGSRRRPVRRVAATREAARGVTVVDPQSNMTYQAFLPEAAVGSVEPRHAVVALHRLLRWCQALTAAATRVKCVRRVCNRYSHPVRLKAESEACRRA